MSDLARAAEAQDSTGRPVEERVLALVRDLARETGGHRAAGAVSLDASLEREVGLGSLERVELLTRLERVFARSLDERFLRLDSPRALAEALSDGNGAAAPSESGARAGAPEGGLGAPRRLARPPATIHEALWRRAEAEPARPHVYMREDDGREHTVSLGSLLEAARAVAGGLRERGVSKGDTVALMLPTGFDFLRAFQGILLSGAIPVPIYPPVRLDGLEEYALRQSAILADAGAVLLVTVPRAIPVADLLRARVPSLTLVTTPEELASLGEPWAAPVGASQDAALVQYTSGSTGQPKGVLLSHANLLANIAAIAAGVEARPSDIGASWLPLYHDMGLIGAWLFCLYHGFPIDIQSPLAFLSRPERWLWAIHRRRATLSPAPNFAYELCVRKIPDAALEGLDLSSWRCALNGAEAVSPDTLERFARRFAPHGFRREALLPVYGLAESSVALCFPAVGRGPRVDSVGREAFQRDGQAVAARDGEAALRFVSVGRPLPGHEVRILDDALRELPERRVGRLAFRGPSTTAGYFRKPDATAAITLSEGFLDSGDLAYRADGEVYLAGRLKDLIIKGGRNLAPEEIEELAASVAGIRRGCIAAFGVPQEALGTESLVIVAESREKDAAARDRLASAVTEKVATAIGVPPDQVVLVGPGDVPKTSSGKVRRSAARELYLEGALGKAGRTSRATRARLVASAAAHELRTRARALRHWGYLAGLGLVLVPTTALAWALAAILPAGPLVRRIERAQCRLALRACGMRLAAIGSEQLRGEEAFVLACNHASYVDIPALVALVPRPFLFVAKREVLSWPLISTFVRKCGHLPVDRFDTAQSVADAAQVASAIQGGHSVLVFPEGTFTTADGLRPFRLGAFKTAVETGARVVPMALRGTRRALRGDSLALRPSRISLWIGAPIAADGEDWKAVVRLRDRVAEAIAAECGEPRLDLVAGGPERG